MGKSPCSSKEEVSAHIGNMVRSEINKNADYDLEEWIQSRIHIGKGDTVLDIGCGNGKQVGVFSDLVGVGGKVIVVDIFSQVPGLMEKAREKLAGKKKAQRFPPLRQGNVCCDEITSSIPFSSSR